MFQVTLGLALVTEHLGLGISDLTRVMQFVRCGSRRDSVVLYKALLFDRELHGSVQVDILFLDPFGYSRSELLACVVSRSRHIEVKSVDRILAFGGHKACRASHLQGIVVLRTHHTSRFILTRPETTVDSHILESLHS